MPFQVCALGEQAACAAVLADLASRDRGGEAVMIFREPTDPDAAVVPMP